jgi:hypothetical protein
MTTIFPIAYFAPISYFQKLLIAEKVRFEIWESYPKHSSRNHCKILSPNGVLELIVPLKKPSKSKTITKDVLIDYSTDWQKKHWRSFISAYSSAPYFDHYGIEIEEIIFQNHKTLVALNQEIHERVCGWLGINIPFIETEDYLKSGIIDYRNDFKQRNEMATDFYQQVFTDKSSFVADLSILDAIFNLGPMTRKLIS